MNPFFLMLFGHVLADYPLQGDFLARAKNPSAPVAGVPWWQAMMAHAAIHAGMVYVITQSPLLAAIEYVAHFWIDFAKCRGKIGYNVDQALHIACKFMYAVAMA